MSIVEDFKQTGLQNASSMTILVSAWRKNTKKNVVKILSLWSKFLAGKC
jgi:hypothetical protein